MSTGLHAPARFSICTAQPLVHGATAIVAVAGVQANQGRLSRWRHRPGANGAIGAMVVYLSHYQLPEDRLAELMADHTPSPWFRRPQNDDGPKPRMALRRPSLRSATW